MSEEDTNAGWMNISSSSHAIPRKVAAWKFTAFGKGQIEEFMSAQTQLLDKIQKRSKYWFERVQSPVNSVLEVASKMTVAGSLPDAMKTYHEWICRQFKLMAEDVERILGDTQKLIMNGT